MRLDLMKNASRKILRTRSVFLSRAPTLVDHNSGTQPLARRDSRFLVFESIPSAEASDHTLISTARAFTPVASSIPLA